MGILDIALSVFLGTLATTITVVVIIKVGGRVLYERSVKAKTDRVAEILEGLRERAADVKDSVDEAMD